MREFDYGVIINSFAAEVDARLRDRARERDLPGRGGRQREASRERLDNRSDRILLGESMWARHTVEQLERETLALKTHGDKRRFRLFDPTHGRVRRVSAHDIRRRAYAEAQRLVAGVNFSSPEARAHARQQVLEDNWPATANRSRSTKRRFRSTWRGWKRGLTSPRKLQNAYAARREFARTLQGKV